MLEIFICFHFISEQILIFGHFIFCECWEICHIMALLLCLCRQSLIARLRDTQEHIPSLSWDTRGYPEYRMTLLNNVCDSCNVSMYKNPWLYVHCCLCMFLVLSCDVVAFHKIFPAFVTHQFSSTSEMNTPYHSWVELFWICLFWIFL